MIDRLIFFALALAFVGLVSLVLKFIQKRRHHKQLLAIRDRIENVYLVSMSPDGEKPDVGKMESVCEFVEQVDMHNRYLETLELLKESGNRFFTGDEINDKIKIQVLCFFFQDGVNVNEDFIEYGQRVENEIMVDRACRHEKLKAENTDWYKWRWHGQNVIEWEVQKPPK